jgi:hypothetical protein
VEAGALTVDRRHATQRIDESGQVSFQKKRTTLDSDFNFGKVAFPQRNAMKGHVLYQGTASAVPERDEPDGLQPLGSRRGLKPTERALSAARLSRALIQGVQLRN